MHLEIWLPGIIFNMTYIMCFRINTSTSMYYIEEDDLRTEVVYDLNELLMGVSFEEND